MRKAPRHQPRRSSFHPPHPWSFYFTYRPPRGRVAIGVAPVLPPQPPVPPVRIPPMPDGVPYTGRWTDVLVGPRRVVCAPRGSQLSPSTPPPRITDPKMMPMAVPIPVPPPLPLAPAPEPPRRIGPWSCAGAGDVAGDGSGVVGTGASV